MQKITSLPQYLQPMARDIVATIGKDSTRDVCNHGADAGYPGFTYYTDTCAFYRKHREEIWKLLDETADAMGVDGPLALIATFRDAKTVSDGDVFENMLAWFALEEVCRMLNPDL